MKKQTVFILFFLLSISLYAQKKNILLEEFSTAPCGFCPEGGIIAENIIHKYDNVFTFTHHAGFGTDSMTINESKTIAGVFTTFAPGACIDRMNYPIPIYTYPNYIAISRQKWDSLCAHRSNDKAYMSLKIENNYDKITRKLSTTLTASFDEDAPDSFADLRFNMLITEDSVTGTGKGYDQKNYFNNDSKFPTLYHKGDTIKGYTHRHVLRAMPSGTWGSTGSIGSKPKAGSSFTKTYTYTIPQRWKEKDIQVIGFVGNYNSSVKKRTVLNSNELPLLSTSTAVEEKNKIPADKIVGIYPNPATDKIHILLDVKKAGTQTISIIAPDGRVVKTYSYFSAAEVNGVSLNLENIAKGIYLLRAENTSGMMVKTFVVE